MRPLAAALALALVAATLAGCTASTVAPGPSAGPQAFSAAAAAPKVKARDTLDALKTFSQAYPYRQSGDATHLAARDWLEAAMKKAGLEVERQTFPSALRGVANVPYDGQNILGIKWGAEREHWVVVGGHYDITEGAVLGTYDDGSGTILTEKLAEAFAKLDTTRTIAFILFDQEERGLVGSHYFVESVLKGQFKHKVTVDAMIDLDMVGITFPHPAKLVAWQNSPTLKNWSEEARKTLKIPDKSVEYRKPRGGSSDGASFIAAGIPTIYYWSDWDDVVLADGTPFPSSYPWWHQADTYDTMVAMAGDEATLEKGFQTVLDIVSPLVLTASTPAFVPDAEQPAAK